MKPLILAASLALAGVAHAQSDPKPVNEIACRCVLWAGGGKQRDLSSGAVG